MEIFNDITKLNQECCVALGFFDGMHIAHQKIIKKTVEISKERNIIPTVFTLTEKPSLVDNTKITTNKQRIMLFEEFGIEQVFMIDLKKIINITPLNFVENILYKSLNAKVVVCGENYHFGKGGTASCKELINLCADFKINVYVQKLIYALGDIVSSSRIKKALRNGDTNLAQQIINRNNFIK